MKQCLCLESARPFWTKNGYTVDREGKRRFVTHKRSISGGEMIRLLWLMTMLGTCSASYFPSGSSSSLALIPQPSEDSVDEVMAFGYGQVLKGLIGGLIFFYGRQFPVSLLIYQSAMVTGLPGMKENWQAIRSSWRRARAALDTELPEITRNRKSTIF